MASKIAQTVSTANAQSATSATPTFDFLCRAQEHPPGLYYALCREKPYSSAVGKEQAERLFILSEQLCGITYGEVRA